MLNIQCSINEHDFNVRFFFNKTITRFIFLYIYIYVRICICIYVLCILNNAI